MFQLAVGVLVASYFFALHFKYLPYYGLSFRYLPPVSHAASVLTLTIAMVIKWGANAKDGAIYPQNEKFENPPPWFLILTNTAILAASGLVTLYWTHHSYKGLRTNAQLFRDH